jgi:carbon monoxide dehydrogenase subunit G
MCELHISEINVDIPGNAVYNKTHENRECIHINGVGDGIGGCF